jgi:tripartite-type tricarboxylate transporter receptor subunit TctC
VFKSMAKIDIVHVPHKGMGPAITDLMAGQVQVLLVSLTAVETQMQSGRLRAIGVSSPKRSSFLPNLPAIAETLPGYESQNWWGLLVPAATPQPVIERLYAATAEVLQSRETAKRMESEGAEPVRMTPPEFGRFIAAELAKWGRVARDVGIKAE